MQVKLITPEQEVFEGEINQAKFPGISGQFEVLKDHASMISTLGKGPVILNTDQDGMKTFQIESGVVEILDNSITVLVESMSE